MPRFPLGVAEAYGDFKFGVPDIVQKLRQNPVNIAHAGLYRAVHGLAQVTCMARSWANLSLWLAYEA